MMTIDEAIAHAKEVAKESRENIITGSNLEPYESDCNAKCEQCAEEHEKLAEWLEDYKRLLELEKSILANEDGYLATMCERVGYSQAIDDFAEAVRTAVTEKDDIGAYDNPSKRICEILKIEAEQLKEGE